MDPRLTGRLSALIGAFENKNPFDLKRIGNDAISDAVLNNSMDLAEVSVTAYSLYKMLTKRHITQSPRWKKIGESVLASLRRALEEAEKGNGNAFRKSLGGATGKIEEIDYDLSNFARGIREKAKIKQASTAYAMGMSLSQAAELAGAERNELQRYIGITRIHDEQPATKGISERLKAFREALS